MTPQEKQLLEFIRERIESTGIAPTFREMAEFTGVSSRSTACAQVESLIRQGHLVRRPRAKRGLALNNSPLAHVPTPALRAELARREAGGQP